MANCNYCGGEINGFPHKCKYCGRFHCSKHLLPEDHDCEGLEKYKEKNSERWKRHLINTFSRESKQEPKRIEEKKKHPIPPNKNRNFKSDFKYYFFNKYKDLKEWLKKREHNKYYLKERLNYLIITIFILIASIIGFGIFYSNAQKLNEINLWIIRLSGVLILTSLFFTIKFGWRLGKEIINILKRQRNWLKYLIIILIIILLWQSYTHKDTILNPIFNIYNKTNFSLFSPLKLNNISLGSSIGKNNSLISNVKKIFTPEPERKDECIQTFARLNSIRVEEGKKSISWDDRAYNFAVARSKDMYERSYFDHVTPEGKCADDFKSEYGFGSSEFLAENAGGMSYYNKGNVAGNCDEALDGWLNSRGHRYNLLYTTHNSGAIGCYYEICVFFGVNNDGFGAKPCNTGDEGLSFWQTAPKQPGEV